MRHLTYIITTVLVLVLTSCSSTRKTLTPTPPTTTTQIWQPDESLQSRISLRLATTDKDITLGGNLKLKRDALIQINLTYILGINVGTIEFTPRGITVVSRATHQYATATYDQLSTYLKHTITFSKVQDYIWGQGRDIQRGPLTITADTHRPLTDGRTLPTRYQVKLQTTKTPLTVTLQTTSTTHVQPDDIQTLTIDPNRYQALTIEQVARMLMTMIK